MFHSRVFGVAGLCLALASLNVSSGKELGKMQPPKARIAPVTLEKHGHVRTDNYYWLNERENPEVLEYLKAENAYTDEIMRHTEGLQETLFQEFKARIKQTDISVPYRLDGYFYYTRVEDGKEYPFFCRKKGSLKAPEEIMLDANAMAEGHEYFSVDGQTVSPDGNLLAFAADTAGRRFYTIRFKDLATGRLLEDAIPDVTSNLAWANDSETFFYTRQDPATLRPYQVYRHILGRDPAQDELVFEEKDETFACYTYKTKSKKYIIIASEQTLSTELRYLDADASQGTFKVFLPRERDLEYHVDHCGNHFYVRTNWQAKNFRLMKTPLTSTGKESWEEVIPQRDDVLLEGFEVFEDFLVPIERKDGLIRIRVMPWSGAKEHYLDFGEPVYVAYPEDNRELDTPVLRYVYSSLTTPKSVLDYDMGIQKKTLLKREEVLGGFDSNNYVAERLHATASDGVKIPISVVYRKGLKKDGTNPMLLYGYGSYGYSMEAYFSPYRVSTLDRGFVYAIAHVRGGQELGRWWYEDGKLLKKKNTFTDFIACAEYLVGQKYTSPSTLFAMGASAGGLLAGAVVNMRPDLFKGVIAEVPFVDVVTTMLDESIPLTTGEYDEWGNPNVKEYYDYMISYSPYDNVEAKDYPNLLVTTGLQDSQVQYWEPAKWVAELRARKTDNNLLLLKTEIEAGHGGVSGRYKQYKEIAFLYAFMMDIVGIKK